MLNKFYYVLFLYLISFMLLNSQESYNKYYYKSRVTNEDMHNGIFNNQTESEKEWVKEWKQQLKDKANFFKERTGFAGNITFHDDRASLKRINGNFVCSPVVDSISAISSANQIFNEITDLINVPRNQLLNTSVRKLEYSDRTEWVVEYSQSINGIEVNNSGIGITYKENGTFKTCGSVCYPNLSTDIYPQFTQVQIEEKIRKEYDLSDEITFKHGKYYYVVGRFGELKLEYSAIYWKDGLPYKVRINAISGEIISNGKFIIPE